jgi:uncharacterized UPF0160 family protein
VLCEQPRYFDVRGLQSEDASFVCTHHGTFHCDEAMACGMLRLLDSYRSMPVVRTRDPSVIGKAAVVVDVGGEYDPSSHRYDHHQREFQEPFYAAPEGEMWTGEKEPVRMSSAGLVFKHFGREVIQRVASRELSEAEVDLVFQRMYSALIREVDAIDNGVEPFDGDGRYRIRTGLASRIGRLNAAWNEEDSGPEVENARFKKAVSQYVWLVRSGLPTLRDCRCIWPRRSLSTWPDQSLTRGFLRATLLPRPLLLGRACPRRVVCWS